MAFVTKKSHFHPLFFKSFASGAAVYCAAVSLPRAIRFPVPSQPRFWQAFGSVENHHTTGGARDHYLSLGGGGGARQEGKMKKRKL